MKSIVKSRTTTKNKDIMQDDIDSQGQQDRPATDRATTLRSVWQDKRAAPGARQAQDAPFSLRAEENSTRAHAQQGKQAKEPKRQTVKLTTWVQPGVKRELERIAQAEGLSLSRTAAAALEDWLAERLHVQHAAILQPIIEQAIATQMRAYSSRLALLLVRSAFATEQTRALATNILARQQGVTQPVLESILDGTSNTARRNITRVTPQLAALIQEVEQWLEQNA